MWLSKTVGFWNLRADAELGDIGLVALGQVHLAVEIDGAAVRPGLAVMMSIIVVLPAPFGPMIARNSPGATTKESAFQRLEPSKDTETLSR